MKTTARNVAQLFVLLLFTLLFACVPARKFEDMKANRERCDQENTELRTKNKEFTILTTEQKSQIEILSKKIQGLVADTTIQGNTLRRMRDNYEQLNTTYQMLVNKNKELLEGNAAEMKTLLASLQERQSALQEQEEKLVEMEKEIQKKQRGLIKLGQELADSRAELEQKEQALQENQAQLEESQKQLIELQTVLAQKDSAVRDLKRKVMDALLGYENQGLTIEQRNGKVYVSMDNKLLFASGSYDLNAKGKEALKKLATVLETNQDVNVLVEGHTDTDKLSGKGAIKDNWDLSVFRATAVVKIMLEGSSIDPGRLTAAGRGEYHPIDPANTPEAKAKNRRTEIILTPKLDELFKIIEAN